MTSYITAEQCLSAIQADSAWRKKEISSLKQRIMRSEGESRAIMMRAGVLMLYAHWEGFVKFAAGTYIQHINERIARFNAPLTEHYRDLLMWRCVRRKGEFPHAKSPMGLLDVLREWRTNPDRFLADDMIDPESNLSSRVLEKILRIVDIPFTDFESKKNLIDEKLLGRRNPIAHGQRSPITINDYTEADREVRALLDTFQRRIEECVESSSFAAEPAALIQTTQAAS